MTTPGSEHRALRVAGSPGDEEGREAIVVRVAGDLDDLGGQRLDEVLRHLLVSVSAARVVLDLARVDLLDGSGMSHLIDSFNWLTEAGHTLGLRRVRPQVARVLCLVDPDHLLFSCSARTLFIASAPKGTTRARRACRPGLVTSTLRLGPHQGTPRERGIPSQPHRRVHDGHHPPVSERS